MNANVNIPYDDFKKMQDGIAEINEANLKLRKEVADARAEDPSGRIAGLTKLAKAMMEIVGFATANLGPRDIKGWPWTKLVEMSEGLKHLPDFSAREEEFAKFLMDFADECAGWEKKRAATPEKEIPPPYAQHEHPMMRLRHPEMVPHLDMIPQKLGADLPDPNTSVGRLVPRDVPETEPTPIPEQ